MSADVDKQGWSNPEAEAIPTCKSDRDARFGTRNCDIPACFGVKTATVNAPMQTAVDFMFLQNEMLIKKRHGRPCLPAGAAAPGHRGGEGFAVTGSVTRNSALQAEAKWVPTGFLSHGDGLQLGRRDISFPPPSASRRAGTTSAAPPERSSPPPACRSLSSQGEASAHCWLWSFQFLLCSFGRPAPRAVSPPARLP